MDGKSSSFSLSHLPQPAYYLISLKIQDLSGRLELTAGSFYSLGDSQHHMIMGMLISIIRAFLSQNSLFLPYPSPGTCLPLVFTLQYQLLLGEKRKLLSEEKNFFCSIPAQQGSLGDKPKIKRSRQEPVGAAEYGAEQFCTHKYHGQHR